MKLFAEMITGNSDTRIVVFCGLVPNSFNSEVNFRTQIKSMLSAKSFRPTINDPDAARRWLRIFVSDIYARLVEEGVVENKRRPKTMNLHHRSGGQTKSRQAPIPLGRKIDEAGLFEIATNLLGQIILEGRAWPCANLSLAVGGFEDGVVGNMGISAFLVKGEEAKALNLRDSDSGEARPEKRRRIVPTIGIGRFFKTDSAEEQHDEDFGDLSGMDTLADPESKAFNATSTSPEENEATKFDEHITKLADKSALHQQHITDFICGRCSLALESPEALQSHQDWHFATDLEAEEQKRPAPRPAATIPNKRSSAASSKKKSRNSQPEKGQSKLKFG